MALAPELGPQPSLDKLIGRHGLGSSAVRKDGVNVTQTKQPGSDQDPEKGALTGRHTRNAHHNINEIKIT